MKKLMILLVAVLMGSATASAQVITVALVNKTKGNTATAAGSATAVVGS